MAVWPQEFLQGGLSWENLNSGLILDLESQAPGRAEDGLFHGGEDGATCKLLKGSVVDEWLASALCR